jgi:hypothetical protein
MEAVFANQARLTGLKNARKSADIQKPALPRSLRATTPERLKKSGVH